MPIARQTQLTFSFELRHVTRQNVRLAAQ